MFGSQAEKVATLFVTGLFALAIWTTIVSKKSNTSGVLNSAGSALSSSIATAEGNPVK